MTKNKNRYDKGDYLKHGVFFFLYGFFKYIPSPIGDGLRRLVSRIYLKAKGKVRIYEGVTLWYPYRIHIGNNVTLNEFVYLSGYGDLTIGDNVRIGHRTSIITSDHSISDTTIPIYQQPLVEKPVYIMDNVFIGCNVTILGGVTIGQNSVIGAGSVVTKDIPCDSIAGGNPARVIKQRS